MINKKNIIILFCIIVFAAIDFTCLSDQPPNLIGRDMPRLAIKNWISKDKLSPRDLEGRIYIIEFWATWCPHCVKEMPRLNELARKYRQNEVFFITLSQDRDARQARIYLNNNNIELFAAMDYGIGARLAPAFIPMAYIVGIDGKVIWQGHPGSEAFDQEIEQAVKKAPPAFLKDVDLGPYENLRLQLSGCNGFNRAYKKLRMETRKAESETAELAAAIIKTIDAQIISRIEKIRAIRKDDPDTALPLYRKLILSFRGAEPINQAKAEYEKLKNSLEQKNKPEVAKEETPNQVNQKD